MTVTPCFRDGRVRAVTGRVAIAFGGQRVSYTCDAHDHRWSHAFGANATQRDGEDLRFLRHTTTFQDPHPTSANAHVHAMSAIVKTKLKNARDAIGKKNFPAARAAATDVLSYEPENYHAYVQYSQLCYVRNRTLSPD